MSRISGRVIMHADMTAILRIIYGSRFWEAVYQRSLVYHRPQRQACV